MRRVMLAGGLALTIALAACGGDDEKNTAPRTSRTSAPTSSTTVTSATSTTAPCNFIGTTVLQQNPIASETQYLTDVTAVRNGCVDVMTFTFRPSAAVAPSYQISYEAGPFMNSAGEEVRPQGSAYLKIRFEPAWIADLNQEGAPLTYTGPKVITPTGLNAVRELALYDAFEGVVGWVVGIDGQRPVSVEASQGRVVVTVGP